MVADPWPRTITKTRADQQAEAEAEAAERWRQPGPSQSAPPAATAERATPGEEFTDAARRVWISRGVAGMAAAGCATWLAKVLLAPSPLAPAAVGLIAGGLTLVLPRVGWLALTAAAAATAISEGQPGVALLIAIAMLVPVVLMVLRPTAWPLAAGAPALGVLGLAGAWPALAGRAGTPWRRAALGAAGWIFLVLATPLAGRVLYLPPISGIPPPTAWGGSAFDAFHQVLVPIVTSGALAPVPVWALGAAVLPWLVRGRSLAWTWRRRSCGAHSWSRPRRPRSRRRAGTAALGAAPSATLGAVAAAAVALAPSALAAWRGRSRLAGGSQPGFP